MAINTPILQKAQKIVETSEEDGDITLTFMWDGEMPPLQAWLASVKKLLDVSVSDHDLDTAFQSLYEKEEEES